MKKIITLYSLKGGSGKSTIAILTALYLHDKGYKVALLDSNTEQNTTADFIEQTGIAIPCFKISKNLERADLDALNVDFIIIDGSPSTSDYMRKILMLSDFVIVPQKPAQFDLASTTQNNSLTLLADLQKEHKNIGVVINLATQYHAKKVTELKEQLALLRLPYHGKLSYRLCFELDYENPYRWKKNSQAYNEIGYLVDTMLESV